MDAYRDILEFSTTNEQRQVAEDTVATSTPQACGRALEEHRRDCDTTGTRRASVASSNGEGPVSTGPSESG
jgi:hypothetical protein